MDTKTIKEASTTAGATVRKPKMEVDIDKFAEFKAWQAKAVSEWKDYKIDAPESVLEAVPESFRNEIITAVKNETLAEVKEKAKQELLGLNSAFRKKKEMEIRVNIRNFLRQKKFNEDRLSTMIGESVEFIKEGEAIIRKYEVEFLIEKLNVQITLLEEEVKRYKLDMEELTKNL